MSLQVLYGCVECLHNVQSYLTIRDVNSFHATCKYLRNQLMDQFYKEMIYAMPASLTMSIHGLSTPEISYKLPFINNSLGFYENIARVPKDGDETFYHKNLFVDLINIFSDPNNLMNLSDGIYSVSSVDRREERPFNCLKVSRCYLSFISQMKILKSRWSDTEEFDNIKYHIGINPKYLFARSPPYSLIHAITHRY